MLAGADKRRLKVGWIKEIIIAFFFMPRIIFARKNHSLNTNIFPSIIVRLATYAFVNKYTMFEMMKKIKYIKSEIRIRKKTCLSVIFLFNSLIIDIVKRLGIAIAIKPINDPVIII